MSGHGGGGKASGPGQHPQQQHGPINLTKSDEQSPPATTAWLASSAWSTSSAGAAAASSSSSGPRPSASRGAGRGLVALPQQTAGAQKPAETVAVLGHHQLVTVNRAVGVQGGGAIALMAPCLPRPSTPGGTHLQSTYHLARGGSGSGGSSPRVMGPQAVRVGHLPISSIVAPGGHTVSYQVSHRAVAPPTLPASLVVPVTSISGSGQPVLLRAAPAAPSQAGGTVKTAAKSGKLSTVTMTAAGVGVRAGGPARVTVGHTSNASRTVSPQARLVSPAGSAAPRPLHITHITTEKLPRAGAASPALRQAAPLTYSMLPSVRGQQQVVRGAVHPLISVPAPAGGFAVTASAAGDRGEALPLTVKTGPAATGVQAKAVSAGQQITMTVPWTSAGQQGAKVITQPAHGPPLQLQPFLPTQSGSTARPAVAAAAASVAGSGTAAPAAAAVPAAAATAAAAATPAQVTAIPVAKVLPQQQRPTSRDPAPASEPQRHPGEVMLAPAGERAVPSYGIPAGVVYDHPGGGPARPPAPGPSGSVRLSRPPESRLQPHPASPQAIRMTSPRPSILRKRESEMTAGRAVRNLSQQLAVAVSAGGGGGGGGSPQASPRRPDSSGHSSSTISASSSPGEPAAAEPADEPAPSTSAGTPPPGLSPRKKPRKQNLASTAAAAPPAPFPAAPFDPRAGSDDEMEFIRQYTRPAAAAAATPTQQPAPAARPAGEAAPTRRPAMSLLNSHGARSWRPASSHFVKYSDVRGRDERRPTIADLASQRHIAQKVNGWKIHHISGQMDELAEVERTVHRRLSEMLRTSERMSFSRREDKEITKLNELIKGNVQRSKILRDQLSEAKVQIGSVFEHKANIEQAIERYGRKRPARKRDRR